MKSKYVKLLKRLIFISLFMTLVTVIWLLHKDDGKGVNPKFRVNKTIVPVQGHKVFIQKHPNNLLPVFNDHTHLNPNIIKNKNMSAGDKKELSKDMDTNQVVVQHGVRLELFNKDASEYQPCYEVHGFYYPWYGNPEHDGKYLHWNHPFLPHWNKVEAMKWPQGQHEPPDDVGANFYPLLGPYSSKDKEVVDKHMQMFRYARIGVVVVSWYPPGDADNEGLEPDSLMPLILDMAHKYDLKVAIHVEPFKKRNHVTMKEQIRYILDSYGKHPAFYRTNHGNKTNLPLLYIYDSYLVESDLWAKIFKDNGPMTVRGTDLDAIFIGLLVDSKHQNHILKSGFDGFYTYFATNGFTFGSTWANWQLIKEWAVSNKLLFIPSVGPGYIDTEVRPWNAQNTRKRLNGNYYKESFNNALKVSPDFISITSFNEWHEGTQIEPAVAKKTKSRTYLDYEPLGPNNYLDLTRNLVSSCSEKNKNIKIL